MYFFSINLFLCSKDVCRGPRATTLKVNLTSLVKTAEITSAEISRKTSETAEF